MILVLFFINLEKMKAILIRHGIRTQSIVTSATYSTRDRMCIPFRSLGSHSSRVTNVH